MIWTTQKPTQLGYHWFREPSKRTWIVFLYQSNDGVYVYDDSWVFPIEDYQGEWAGPIPEPVEKEAT